MFRPSARAHHIIQAKRRDIERREQERAVFEKLRRAIRAARFADEPFVREEQRG